MESRFVGKDNLYKQKRDGEKIQGGYNEPEPFDPIRNAAKQLKKTKVKFSQERTQEGDGESSSTPGTGEAFQESPKDVPNQTLATSSKREATEEIEHANQITAQRSDTYQEGIDMIKEAHQNDSLSVEELAKQAEEIANWIDKHQICLLKSEKEELNKCWEVFNNKLFYDEGLERFKPENIEEVKKSIKGYLWEAYWSLRRAKKLERVKEQTSGLEGAISLITQHREEFKKIGYDYESFGQMQQNASYTKDAFLADRYVSCDEEDYLMCYSKMIFKMSHDLESFLKIDADLERKQVSERKERIEQLLEVLPEVRPTVSDLPREQWWKLYIDAPMHKKAQMLSDPGRFFDQDRSPGYQKSMICLFEKILVPAQNRIQERMNYDKYTEIHEIATEYIPDEYSKKYMRASGGIAIVKPLGYEQVSGSHYGLANVGDEEMCERLTALQELQGEYINGRPLLQNWKSEEHDFRLRVKELAESGPNAIAVSWVDQTCKFDRSSYTIGNGAIEIIMAYRKAECPRHVNAILERYYQGRERLDQNERQRLTEIARTVRALHVMHPKGDGNGRTHIFGLMNKWLIEEGFPPAILPNGPGVFGGLKTLDGLVEDMLEGMHAFVKVVEESKKEG